jgi:large subunit ribosomal protein L15
MAINKRKKNRRQRGSKTHGWGAMKKHRGAGHRGGRGMAGTGKRCDSKKPMIWGDVKYFGKHGFKKKNVKTVFKTITIRIIEQKLDRWASKNLIEEKAGAYSIDLAKIGYNKLLSNGKVTKKLNIQVAHASPKAVEKVKAAGGDISGMKTKEDKTSKKPEAKAEKIKETKTKVKEQPKEG